MARERMGFDFGLEDPNLCLKRKFRWLFRIPQVSSEGANTLPPEKGARPSLSFKEVEAQHLNEVIYFPGKPDWKPINLTLYDLKKNNNPIIEWLKQMYDPQSGAWKIGYGGGGQFKKDSATLEMYDGCGGIIESWTFENVWPNNIEWGELDMADSNYITVDLTLRYDRAYTTV
jgi:hypothetical protein